jgi:hypothetical protein
VYSDWVENQMHLEIKGELICLEVNTLWKLIDPLDAQLKGIEDDVKNWDYKKYPDPDSCGVFDFAEALAGMGFVACQWFLASTHGWYQVDKLSALKLGPRHSSGITIAEIINHGANYWKHNDEWHVGKKKKDAERIIEAFAKLGVNHKDDYPLTNLLVKINPKQEEQFAPVIPELEKWGKMFSKISQRFNRPAETSRLG